MDKDFWRRELQVAAYAGVQTVEYGLPGPLVFVTTCLRREASLLASLAINGAILFRFRSWLRFAVMSFGDDAALVQELRARLQPLLSCGMLLLASGGTAGLNHVQLTGRAPEAPPLDAVGSGASVHGGARAGTGAPAVLACVEGQEQRA